MSQRAESKKQRKADAALAAAASPAAKSVPYRVMKRPSDGRFCIFLPTFNVVIAEFYPEATVDAEKIGAILAAAGTPLTTNPEPEPVYLPPLKV